MKKKFPLITTLIVAVLFASTPLYVKAQQVNYKVLKDNPKDVNNLWVYLDLAQMDFGIGNIDGASFNAGIWSTGTFKEKLGGDFIFRYGWLTFGKLGGSGTGDKLKSHLQFELGGFYHLKQTSRTTSTSVILSQKTSTVGDKRYTETRSIKVPANKVSTIGVRGGFLSMRSVYGMNDIKENVTGLTAWLSFPDRINYSMTGVYLGLLSTKTHNVIINTDTDGKALKARRSRVYLDAMILPVSSAKLGGVDYKAAIDPGVFGFRVGWQALPVELRKVKGEDVKTNGFSFGVEAGMRPFDGLFITGTWSLCLTRKKLPALGYVLPESERNTSE